MTIEQEARDLLERMGFESQSMSAGDVVELANLIAENHRLRKKHGETIRDILERHDVMHNQGLELDLLRYFARGQDH